MAKTNAAIARAEKQQDSPKLSAKVQKAIDKVKRPFADFVKGYTVIAQKRAELAPLFMNAFHLWANEVGRGASFVRFVQVMFPEVPSHRDDKDGVKGYRNNAIYQSAEYLRRLNNNTGNRSGGAGDGSQADGSKSSGGNGNVRRVAVSSPLMTLMATVLAIIPEKQQLTVWQAAQSRFGWNQDTLKRAQDAVKAETALIEIHGRNLDRLRLSIPTPVVRDEKEATGTEG